jgi:hypothetical protein
MTCHSRWILRVGWAAILLSYPSAQGQIPIRYVEGKVLLDGRPIVIRPAKFPGRAVYPTMKTGAVLETPHGRAELATGIYLDQNGSSKMLSDHRSEVVFEIRSGHAIVNTTALPRTWAVTIEYQGATIVFEKGGEFRIDADLDRLQVYRGKATITYGVALQCSEAGACRLVIGPDSAKTVELHKGEQSSLNAALSVSAFDTKESDAFTHWVARRLAANQPNPVPPCLGLGGDSHSPFGPAGDCLPVSTSP